MNILKTNKTSTNFMPTERRNYPVQDNTSISQETTSQGRPFTGKKV
jgi:hypothetical protein